MSYPELSIYSELEVRPAIQELFGEANLLYAIQNFLPQALGEHILSVKDEIKSVEDFQRLIIVPVLQFIEKESVTSLTCNGLDHLDLQQKYLFISNHRDIVLDSAFMNWLKFEHGFSTAIMAVGDNLMRHRISELIFRLNKSFVIKRSGSPTELYHFSVALSHFIQQQISGKRHSVWIAQREGRAKDGNDRTQVGLLKMLSLAAEGDLPAFFAHLNIVPVSISYEIDPCCILKTKEYLQKLADPTYKKSFKDDVDYMLRGLSGRKGNVHIQFGKPLDAAALAPMEASNAPKKQLESLALLIDKAIHQNYRLHPVHYVAYDLLHGDNKMATHYSAADKEKFSQYFDNQVLKLDGDPSGEGRKYLLGIYANPVVNRLNGM